MLANMATNSRDSIFEDVQSDQELSDKEINDDFEAVDDSDESDIDVGVLESLSERGSEDESSEDEGDNEEVAWSQDFRGLMFQEFSGMPGIKVAVPNESDAKVFFSLLFGDQAVDLIACETNPYVWQKLINKPAQLDKWQDVTSEELRAYFGLCIIMGINSLPRIAMYWSSDQFIGNTGIQNVMTKNWFEAIIQFLHFSDSTREPQRAAANYDRLFKVRVLLSRVHENIYEPSKNISIDEGMIAYKGRLSFRQYMPAKPTKYGIKVWMAAESDNGYVANFSVNLGSKGNEGCTNGLGYDVVKSMASPFLHKHRHAYFDNFFTGIGIMDYLLAQNTYACGTVRVNRKGLPPCVKKKLKQREIVKAQRGHLLFTKWHNKRDVAFLSTNISPTAPTRPVQCKKKGREITIQKPLVPDTYTANMGGVDCADQLRTFYFAGWQCRKWYKYIFWFVFNLSVFNSFVLSSVHRG